MLFTTTTAQSAQLDTVEVLLIVGALIVLLMIGGSVIMIYRRKILADDRAAPQHSSILDELRASLDSGKMTPDEYERARRTVVDRARGAEPVRREPVSPELQRWDRTAEPGVDLTGDPLPRPGEDATGGSGGGADNNSGWYCCFQCWQDESFMGMICTT